MAENGLSAYPASSQGMFQSGVINLLSLTFNMFLYLAYRGKWPDLTCGSPGVWAWCPKFWFQVNKQEFEVLLSVILDVHVRLNLC
jgi:hypothetical protein